MKKEEVPQDKSFLTGITKEVCYAKNDNGSYEPALSSGWHVKHDALNVSWSNINNEVDKAYQSVKNGERSPIYFFMLKNLMDIGLLSSYTGFWRFTIKRHCKPHIFSKLKERTLEKYAKVFDITIDELKNI